MFEKLFLTLILTGIIYIAVNLPRYIRRELRRHNDSVAYWWKAQKRVMDEEQEILIETSKVLGRLFDWLDQHPFESISHPEAQELLLEYIGLRMIYYGTYGKPNHRISDVESWLPHIEDWRFNGR